MLGSPFRKVRCISPCQGRNPGLGSSYKTARGGGGGINGRTAATDDQQRLFAVAVRAASGRQPLKRAKVGDGREGGDGGAEDDHGSGNANSRCVRNSLHWPQQKATQQPRRQPAASATHRHVLLGVGFAVGDPLGAGQHPQALGPVEPGVADLNLIREQNRGGGEGEQDVIERLRPFAGRRGPLKNPRSNAGQGSVGEGGGGERRRGRGHDLLIGGVVPPRSH